MATATKSAPRNAHLTGPNAVERPLAPGYYVANFATVLDTVRERYDDLLTPAEIAFVRSFAGAGEGARRLYVRLVSRRGPVFRRDLLDYAEIPDLDGAIVELTDARLADAADEVAAAELVPLFRCAELRTLAGGLGARVPPAARKGELVAALTDLDAATLGAALRRRTRFVRPLGQETVLVYRLLFFGNLAQDWTELLLSDLGVVRYERYPLDRAHRLFPHRRAVDDALGVRQARTRVDLHLAAGDLAAAAEVAAAVAEHAWHATSRTRADRVLLRAARALERAGELDAAMDLYAAAATPPARERRARVLERLGRDEEALLLCRAMAAAPRDETEPAVAARVERRLRWRRGERPSSRRRRRRVVDLELAPRPGVAVEDRVVEHLAATGRRALFSENWLWRSLFGLAFWDVVFAPVPGAFQHPFQYAPLDLHGPDFRRARRDAVERRLADLAVWGDLPRRLLAVHDAKAGIANALVPWGDWVRPALELALAHLDGDSLARVCDRLSRDPGRYRRGLPDLFVARDGAAAPRFELWEVKGPGDQLRPEQTAWLDYLDAHGIPAAVARVRWSGAEAVA